MSINVMLELPKDINRFCRACMNVAANALSSFDNYLLINQKQTELCTMFESVTSLEIIPQDGLPVTVCHKCTEHITAMYIFKKQCRQVDEQLRSLKRLTKPSLEKTEDKEFVNPKNKNNFKCGDCSDGFTSYYKFCMHTIMHNRKKNLFQRYIDNRQDKNVTTLTCTSSQNYYLDDLKLVQTNNLRNVGDLPKRLVKDKQELIDQHIRNDTNERVNGNATIKDLQEKPSKDVNCKFCTNKFNSRKELISHVCYTKVDNISEGVKCPLCRKILTNSSLLSLHFLKHAISFSQAFKIEINCKVVFCEICGVICQSESHLNAHYNEKHDSEQENMCIECCQVFESKTEWLDHCCVNIQDLLETDCKQEVSCVLCNRVFTSNDTLLSHSIEHITKNYSCKKCSLSFCTRDCFSFHTASHGVYKHNCNTCGKVLSTKSALKAHIVGVHFNELCHKCNTCGKSFATKNRLKIHSEIHNSHKKYVCYVCGYRTHKAGDLRTHLRTHTSERPYKCNFVNCNGSFKTSSHLCDHVRSHLRIKKFKCIICDANFSSSNGLKIHNMQHTGEKPHSCSICNMKFRRKHHLKIHMKQHESA